MKDFLVSVVLVLSVTCLAQDGTRVFEFLNVTTSPRQAALGGNAQSMWDADPNMSYWNPALMNAKSHNQAAINYASYLSDVKFGSVSYTYQYDYYNFFSIHAQYFDYGNFKGADEFGNLTNDFTAQDAAITIGYAKRLNDFFTVGANAKYIHSNIESYTSNGLAADLGLVFHDIDYDTNVSLTVRNIGMQLKTYSGLKEPLPLQINLGISHKLDHVPLELSATLHDLQKFDISDPYNIDNEEISSYRKGLDHLSIGAELFPNAGFNARFGYNFKRGNDLNVEETKNFSGVTYGFGIRISSFRLEYAHANYHSASNVDHLGIRIDLENFLQRRYY